MIRAGEDARTPPLPHFGYLIVDWRLSISRIPDPNGGCTSCGVLRIGRTSKHAAIGRSDFAAGGYSTSEMRVTVSQLETGDETGETGECERPARPSDGGCRATRPLRRGCPAM